MPECRTKFYRYKDDTCCSGYVIPFQNYRITATSPVAGDEEEMILPKSTSLRHNHYNRSEGNVTIPFCKNSSRGGTPSRIMWRKCYNLVPKEPSHDSKTHEQMHHTIPQESTHSGRSVTTGLDVVE